MEDSKDEKNLLTGLNLHYVDVMALNDDEKGLSIEFFGFIFSTICLESGNAEFVFFEEIIRRFENHCHTNAILSCFDDALSLLQRLMADFHSSKRT